MFCVLRCALSAESTYGRLSIRAGDPTEFGLKTRTGVGWKGYDFWGKILSATTLSVSTKIDGDLVTFAMIRVPNPAPALAMGQSIVMGLKDRLVGG